eukprot:jgi/Botrbrau1/12518/Bobra.0169s0060.1
MEVTTDEDDSQRAGIQTCDVPSKPGGRPRSHHSLGRPLRDDEKITNFGSTDGKEVQKEINRMGQKELQKAFNQIFPLKTGSNNNNWLRRKLLEAAGIPQAKSHPRGRPPRPNAKARPAAPVGRGFDTPTSSHSTREKSRQFPSFPVTGGVRKTTRRRKPTLRSEGMAAHGLTRQGSTSSVESLTPGLVGPMTQCVLPLPVLSFLHIQIELNFHYLWCWVVVWIGVKLKANAFGVVIAAPALPTYLSQVTTPPLPNSYGCFEGQHL